jgi:hypothetical protein
MAFALAELYEACQLNKTLTHAAYGNLGGVRGAIAKRADAAYNKLDDDARNPTFRTPLVEVAYFTACLAN